MKTLFHSARCAVRRITKPLHLQYLNWKHQRCESQVKRFAEMRHDLVQLEVTERRRQVALALRRNEIARW